MKHRHLFAMVRGVFVLLALFFSGCAGSIEIHRNRYPVSYGHLPESALTGKELSAYSQLLQREREEWFEAFENRGAQASPLIERLLSEQLASRERLALAELCVKAARRQAAQEPTAALEFYLAAAQFCFPGVDEVPLTDEGRLMRGIYNHCCGQVAKLSFANSDRDWSGKPIEVSVGRYSLRIDPRASDEILLSDFDSLQAADQLRLEGFDDRVTTSGVGGALVIAQEPTEERQAADPNIPPVGISLPLTATLEYSKGDRVELRFHDVWKSDETWVGGKRVRLSSDFSAPLATIMSMNRNRHVGLTGMLFPERALQRMALYRLEPFRKEKIPVVFTHGLMSKPATWRETWNALIKDRAIRENYQFWAFMYPTGLPIMYPAAAFHQSLADVRRRHDPRDLYRTDEMVLIGHSLGGVMTSIQVRETGEALYRQFFKAPVEELLVGEDTREALRALFYRPQQSYIKRAVFVATPHLGSEMADNFVGRLGSMLVQLPEDILTQRASLLDAVTEFGETVLVEPANGIDRLRLNNPTLRLIADQPFHPGLTVHSIIGDQGKGDSPRSTDGIVPYESSHFEGVASEKIVPAGHNAHVHPEAIEEIRRILLQHLR